MIDKQNEGIGLRYSLSRRLDPSTPLLFSSLGHVLSNFLRGGIIGFDAREHFVGLFYKEEEKVKS